MDVNKIKILNKVGDKEIILPLSNNWDLFDRESAIVDEETRIIKKIIGEPPNYEIQRFSRQIVDNSTAQEYQFNFYNTATTIWEPTYFSNFRESFIRYTSGSFAKSFFKLDLYDSSDPKTQKIYLSIILPTSRSSELSSNGNSNCNGYNFFKVNSAINFVGRINFTDCCGIAQSVLITSVTYACVDESYPVSYSGFSAGFGGFFGSSGAIQQGPVYLHGEGVNPFIDALELAICECIPDIPPPAAPPNLTYPNFYLDHVGNQEGYYIYWYQDEKLININEFYMTAKFFNANIGSYTRFTTSPQTQTKIPNNDLYYRVVLDYPNKLYKITNLTDLVPVVQANWYEYVNPKIV